MATVAINPPKTPVTKGSSGTATATLPNVCKMPPPPPPFAPTPLPNIGQSGKQPSGYSTTVTIEGQPVAIQGASFGSSGDIASQGTGGGIASNSAEGATKFIGPGSLNVRIEGKNVQLLGDQMVNNCGPGGSPPNSATMAGILQNPKVAASFADNPDNVDHCGAGNHSEEIHRPKVPDHEKDPQRRIDTIKKMAANSGEEFEARAAQHNLDKKHLTSGDQISRRITPEEKAAGLHEEDQKIWMICSICQHRREVDEAPADGGIVEAKSTQGAIEGGKQKKNNAALLAGGVPVTYKSPHMDYNKYMAWTEEGFNMISLPKL